TGSPLRQLIPPANDYLRSAPSAQGLDLAVIFRPGMTIGGHTFNVFNTIGNAAINETGKPAFVAQWIEPVRLPTAIFTLDRIVAADDQIIDGYFVAQIPLDSAIAINGSGQVAYSAIYTKTIEDANTEMGRLGIFVEHHLV